MGKISTFRIVRERLYAMVFDPGDPKKVNELSKLYQLWTNSEYLTDFFSKRKDLFQKGDWAKNETNENGDPLTVREAVDRTIVAAKFFFEYLTKVANGEIKTNNYNGLFIHLNGRKHELCLFEPAKAYGIKSPHWLRFYGIKINDSLFIITGGGIKLVEKMSKCKLLKKELDKLELAIHYFENEKEIDGDLEEIIYNSKHGYRKDK